MKIEIKSQKKNDLLNREEFLLEIVSENNPTFQQVVEFLKKDPETIVVKAVKGNFGRNIFKSEAFVYDSVEAKDNVEYIPKKIRKKLEEEKKKKAEEEAKKKEEEAKAAEEAKKQETQDKVEENNEAPNDEAKSEEKTEEASAENKEEVKEENKDGN